MIALGLLLIALAVLAGVVISVEATDPVSLSVLGWDLRTDGVGAFWGGAATMLVAVIGLALMLRGIRRALKVRKENRRLRKEHKQMEKERARSAPAASAPAPLVSPDPDPDTDRAAGDRPGGDAAYAASSERAYDPAHDDPADEWMTDPYDSPREPAEGTSSEQTPASTGSAAPDGDPVITQPSDTDPVSTAPAADEPTADTGSGYDRTDVGTSGSTTGDDDGSTGGGPRSHGPSSAGT